MRTTNYAGGGYGLNGLSPNGGPISAPLYLMGKITAPMHAVTKEYVDTVLGSVSVNNIVGTIPAERLPAFTGNDIQSAGYGIFELKPTGVVAGTYNKITVNAKGFVTHGEFIDYTTLTNVPWDNITQDKPTTLEGYGITDALKTTGGVMNGALNITGVPTESTHLVNKKYVDDSVDALQWAPMGKIGDMVQSVSSTTPSNYLRANGAVLDKATYTALYAVIGDTFTNDNGGFGYMGQPWRQQHAFNIEQTNSLGSWVSGGKSLIAPFMNGEVVVTKNKLYLISGDYGPEVYSTTINTDGTLGTWTAETPLPSEVARSQAIVTKNRVYLMGGQTDSGVTSTVYTAPINPDGTLGDWATGTPLPNALCDSQAIVTKNRVYLLGGNVQGSSYSSTVHTAPINPDGTLGAWSIATNLPGALGASQAVVTNSRVYLLGGRNTGYVSTVYTAPINSDGTLGVWSTSTSLPTALGYSFAITTRNKVYLIGGTTSGINRTNNTYTAPINADGTLGTWSAGTSFPVGRIHHSVAVVKNRLCLFGGLADDNETTIVYATPFSGGTNDYLALIADNTVNTSTQFKLPDTTSTDPAGMYSYIRAM